eukprot:6316447-Amphidinium_carterae.1
MGCVPRVGFGSSATSRPISLPGLCLHSFTKALPCGSCVQPRPGPSCEDGTPVARAPGELTALDIPHE